MALVGCCDECSRPTDEHKETATYSPPPFLSLSTRPPHFSQEGLAIVHSQKSSLVHRQIITSSQPVSTQHRPADERTIHPHFKSL